MKITNTNDTVKRTTEKVNRRVEHRVEYHNTPYINFHKSPAQWKEIGVNLIIKITELRAMVEQSPDGETTIDKRAEVCFEAHDAVESITAVICCDIVNFDELGNPTSIVGKASRMIMETTCLSIKKFIDELKKVPAFEKQADELLSWCEDQLAK